MQEDITEGSHVMCISEDFPLKEKISSNNEPTKDWPKKGEVLVVDEMLGEYLRFGKYDTENTCNWWFHNRFIPLTPEQVEEGEWFEDELNQIGILKEAKELIG